MTEYVVQFSFLLDMILALRPRYLQSINSLVRNHWTSVLTAWLLDLHCCAMQAGKHEAIVKNVHELLAKLAWDFSPQQLDHLFECFQVRQLRLRLYSYQAPALCVFKSIPAVVCNVCTGGFRMRLWTFTKVYKLLVFPDSHESVQEKCRFFWHFKV